MVVSRSVDSLITSFKQDENVIGVLRDGSNISILLQESLDYGTTFNLIKRYFPGTVAFESHFEYRTRSKRNAYTINAYGQVKK